MHWHQDRPNSRCNTNHVDGIVPQFHRGGGKILEARNLGTADAQRAYLMIAIETVQIHDIAIVIRASLLAALCLREVITIFGMYQFMCFDL
jgi:hypothetical protein